MVVRLFQEKDRERWDKYVLESVHSTPYHLSGWKNVIEKSFGHRTYYLVSEDDQEGINGILPLVQLKSLCFGNFMVSLPFFNYGGICASNKDVQDQLLEKAIKIAKEEKVEHIELRHKVQEGNGLKVKAKKVSMRLELSGKKEDLWNAFPSKLRSQIRKPQKEGMYSQIGFIDEIDSFYKVFSINMRDLGTPVYSKQLFKNILEEFPDSTWVCMIYTKEKIPVASGFLIGFKDMLEIPWASSLRSYNRYSPNMLLYWSSLRFACESGYRVFDFGRSSPGEGTYKFKEQWGAKPVQLYWHYWLKNGRKLPELNPDNPKYSTAIRIWRKLPVGLTRLIGPAIVKNLP